MELEKVKELHKALGQNVYDLIKQFEKSTTTNVTAVNLDVISVDILGTRNIAVDIDVTI